MRVRFHRDRRTGELQVHWRQLVQAPPKVRARIRLADGAFWLTRASAAGERARIVDDRRHKSIDRARQGIKI